MRRLVKSEIVAAFAVSIATILVYCPSLRNGFVYWDDSVYVLNNPYIRSLNLALLKFAFLDFYSYNWHPLTWMTHALDYSLWGSNPFGHHLSNVILHAMNSLLVVILVARLAAFRGVNAEIKPSPPSAVQEAFIAGGVAGLLFGIHPVHVESVAWIAERKDLLCAFFFVLSILAYVGYGNRRMSDAAHDGPARAYRNRAFLLSLFFFLLALLSKPMAVTLPAVLLILDWHPFNRIRSSRAFRNALVEKLPFAALSLVSSIVTFIAQKSGSAVWEAIPLSTRLLVATRSLIVYLRKIIFPVDLLPFYPHPRTASFLEAEFLTAAMVVALITVACVIVAGRRRLFPAAWSYYVVTLLPVLGIIQVGGQAMADRYTYLPSLSPFLIAGLATSWVWAKIDAIEKLRSIMKIGGAWLGILVFFLLSFLTIKQTRIWKDDMTLWSHVIDKEPERVLLAYYHRGRAYSRIGQYNKAIEDYSRVIALNYQPYGRPYIDRGLTYLKIGQVGPALADFEMACGLGDDFGCNAVKMLGNKRETLRPP